MKRILNIPFLLLFLLMGTTITSCKKKEQPTDPTTPGTNEVWIQNSAFNPSTITVDSGTTIKWINKDNMNHTITSDTGGTATFDSGIIDAANNYSITFTVKDTVTYHCSIHTSMHGTVIVR